MNINKIPAKELMVKASSKNYKNWQSVINVKTNSFWNWNYKKYSMITAWCRTKGTQIWLWWKHVYLVMEPANRNSAGFLIYWKIVMFYIYGIKGWDNLPACEVDLIKLRSFRAPAGFSSIWRSVETDSRDVDFIFYNSLSDVRLLGWKNTPPIICSKICSFQRGV